MSPGADLPPLSSNRATEADAHHRRGRWLREEDRLDEAIDAFRRAIARCPEHVAARFDLGKALVASGAQDAAIEVYRQLLATNPGHPGARHLLAAGTGADPLPRAPDGYVEQLFDDYAHRFDEHLDALNYRAPQLIAAALVAAGTPATATCDVLDAGCGTGLSGVYLRSLARRLVGVDLSSGMLDQARQRGTYDELVHGELTAFLTSASQTFDLIVAADTLVYFGDLGPVLRAAAGALRDRGRLVFTLEQLPGGDEAFRLDGSGRYRHGRGYVARSLAVAGFTSVTHTSGMLRTESGAAVHGDVYLAERPARASA
jgi:predicted TPR repeat methyltransferase